MHDNSATSLRPEENWREIDDLVQEVAQLARTGVAPSQFYRGLLERAVRGLAALGGAVWLRDATGPLSVVAQSGELTGSAPEARQRLEFVWKTGTALALPPGIRRDGAVEIINSTPHLLLYQPVRDDRGLAGMIEIRQRAGATAAVQAGYLQFLEVLAELAGEFQRNLALEKLRLAAGSWSAFDDFARRVHSQPELEEVAFEIANAGTGPAQCDRISVLRMTGRQARTLAITGLDTLDRRASAVRRLETLVQMVARTGQPLWFEGDTADLPPRLEKILQDFLQEARSRSVAVLPWSDGGATPRIIGAMVVEQFQTANLPREPISAISAHAELAFRKARLQQTLPFYPVLRRLQRAGWFVQDGRWIRTLTVLAAVAALLAVMLFVQGELEITGRGEVQPQDRRDLFAATDGIVQEINVRHGMDVAAGDLLARMRRPQLDQELSRVTGDILTARKRLGSIQASRLAAVAGSATPERANELTAEEEEVKELLKGLERQEALLLEQQTELEVRSPIAGRILTWEADRRLAARPVQRGQLLMTVANLAGPWVIEVRLPDHAVGHLLAAQQKLRRDLEVRFVLATDPDQVHVGRVEQVALAADRLDQQEPTVLVTVAFDRSQVAGLRPGATVIPRIQCGRSPLGYVWLHELIDTVRAWAWL